MRRWGRLVHAFVIQVDMHTHICLQNIQNIKIFTKSNAKAKSRKCIKIELDFYFPLLKSWSKKKKSEMVGQYKVTKPDIDNLMKTVLDACNNYLWKDDNQIAEITSSKRYGIEPKIIIRIEEI